MAIYYTACRRFDPSHGDRWRSYLEWSGYHHLREVVSTDSLLCPALVHELTEEDWDYNVHQPERAHWFLDCEYLVRRIGYDPSIHNILAISEHPTRVSESIDDFDFCGFDILDSHESLSVLLNCGAFPSIFCAQDLNQYGLLDHLDRAAAIAQRLRDSHGTDSHCGNCSVWGVARYSRNAVAGRYSP